MKKKKLRVMDKLTRDLTIDILSRLPTFSLLQSTCVCKSWHQIITTDPIFTTLRNNRSISHTDALVLTTPCDLSANQLYFTQLTDPPIIRKIDLPSFINGINGRVYPKIVGVCNGLICLATFLRIFRRPGTIDVVKSFYIINPISKENLELPKFYESLSIDSSSIERMLYGFGFDERNQVFKLVVFVFAGDDNVKVFVFTLGGGWRRILGSVPFMMRHAFGNASNVYVDGCLHWITGATMPNSTTLLNATHLSLIIMSFNLSDEAFSVIEIPESVDVEKPFFLMQANYYAIKVLDNCLCWVDSKGSDHTMIWIKKSGESWTKLSFCLQKSLIAPHFFEPVTPIKFEQNGQLFLQYRNRVVCYNVQDNTTRFFNVDEEPGGISRSEGFPFVGSFISIKSH